MSVNQTASVSINNITIAGNERTKPSFFSAELQSFLNKEHNSPNQNNVQILHKDLNNFARHLRSLNMFEAVDINLSLDSYSDERYTGSIKMNVKEKGVNFLQIQSSVKTGAVSDLSMEIKAALRNPLGYGDFFDISSVTTQSGASEYRGSANFRNIGENRTGLNIAVKSETENATVFKTLKTHVDSLQLSLATHDLKHQLIGEIALRDEIPSGLNKKPDSSKKDKNGFFEKVDIVSNNGIYKLAKPSLKSSLKYIFTAFDDRDTPVSPTFGKLLKGNLEIALPPGNAQFIKSEMNAQYHYPIKTSFNYPPLIFSACGSFGFLYPLKPLFNRVFKSNSEEDGGETGNGETFLSDRFHLGGPLSLRGFDINTIGPKLSEPSLHSQNPETVGGNSKTNLLLTLSAPVLIPSQFFQNPIKTQYPPKFQNPLKTQQLVKTQNPIKTQNPFNMLKPTKPAVDTGIRTFVFLNGGSVGLNSFSRVLEPFHQSLTDGNSGISGSGGSFFGPLRISVGGGFSASVGDTVRIEGTYSLPLRVSSGDNLKCFQLGIGLSID